MKQKWIAAGCCSFALLGILACGIAGLFMGLSLPVYRMNQVDSQHAGFRRTTLTHGDSVYVNDYEESALMAFGEQPSKRIGRFPVSLGINGLYAIPGQDVSAYVLEYDPMYQAVYRNIHHPPFDWRAAKFQMMRLYSTGNAVETEDVLVIGEALAAFDGAPMIVPMQADGNYAGYENHWLQSFSDALPGLAYNFGVHIDSSGQVFLAENVVSNQWFLAGSLFVEWINAQR
ncbi:MAG: hypothetical protein HFACDABA_00333 [Anaerolineales bacterium]|nr:hypothetical protein [Anaerolineales bacterium]